MKELVRYLLFLVVASLVLACGGGGTDVAGGGIGGTGISSGPISGFGSIFVAGTEWETGEAEVRIDGEPYSETDLRLGMQTLVRGTKSEAGATGTATSVDVDNAVEGPISAILDVQMDGEGVLEQVTFEVLGRTIVADRGTAFTDGISLEELETAQGQWVEVSGVPDVGGAIRATRVEMEDAPGPGEPQAVEVEGVVSGLQQATGDFSLGSLVVVVQGSGNPDCPGPTLYPHGMPAEGDSVEVKGVLLPAGELCASRVEVEEEIEDSDEFDIEGIVTAVVDANTFSLGDLTVVTDASTLFEPSGLVVAPGMELEVEGPLAGGVLTAQQVEQRASVEIEAFVDSLVGAGPDFVVLGLVIQVFPDGGTEVKDGLLPVPDDRVKVKAVDNGAGGLSAVEVEVKSGGPERARLEGRVDFVGVFSNGSGSFSIQGVVVGVDTATDCLDVLEAPIPCSDFFAALEVGDLAKATDETNPFVFDDVAHSVRLDD